MTAYPDVDAQLRRRWRGIRRALVWWVLVAAAVSGAGWLAGWGRAVALGFVLALYGVADALARTWRTLRYRGVFRHPENVQPVRVTRHYRDRYRLPGLEFAGLWPEGAPPDSGGTPPLSVRVEDLAAFEEGGEALALGRLAPRGRVLLAVGGRVVWPLRRVRAGLPRRMGPYPFPDPGDDEDDDDR